MSSKHEKMMKKMSQDVNGPCYEWRKFIADVMCYSIENEFSHKNKRVSYGDEDAKNLWSIAVKNVNNERTKWDSGTLAAHYQPGFSISKAVHIIMTINEMLMNGEYPLSTVEIYTIGEFLEIDELINSRITWSLNTVRNAIQYLRKTGEIRSTNDYESNTAYYQLEQAFDADSFEVKLEKPQRPVPSPQAVEAVKKFNEKEAVQWVMQQQEEKEKIKVEFVLTREELTLTLDFMKKNNIF